MILKGCQRKLIMMPTKSSSLFETAYFILREDTERREPTPNEMLCEATRILEENALTRKKRAPKRKHLWLALAVGFALGCLTTGTLWLILR